MDVARVGPGGQAQDVAGYVDVDLLDWIPVLMPSLSPTIPCETWSMDKYLRHTLRKLRCLAPGEEGLRKIQEVHFEFQIVGATLNRGLYQVKPTPKL